MNRLKKHRNNEDKGEAFDQEAFIKQLSNKQVAALAASVDYLERKHSYSPRERTEKLPPSEIHIVQKMDELMQKQNTALLEQWRNILLHAVQQPMFKSALQATLTLSSSHLSKEEKRPIREALMAISRSGEKSELLATQIPPALVAAITGWRDFTYRKNQGNEPEDRYQHIMGIKEQFMNDDTLMQAAVEQLSKFERKNKGNFMNTIKNLMKSEFLTPEEKEEATLILSLTYQAEGANR